MAGPRLVAAVLAVFALAILAATIGYPGGSQGVPGPAVVPRLLGVSLLVIGLLLVRSPGSGAPRLVRHQVAIAATMAVLVVYVTLWRTVPYGVLTGLALLAFMRLTGLGWRGAIVAAAIMATALQLLFERGLGVRFQ
ncbi:MAG: tripartite tricarboxylate transporter TctB family protein [Acidobacteria bacterium]|nr:tripartite tricarboxylate transporter TctB family protein [Acidobacteriota bacterium]